MVTDYEKKGDEARCFSALDTGFLKAPGFGSQKWRSSILAYSEIFSLSLDFGILPVLVLCTAEHGGHHLFPASRPWITVDLADCSNPSAADQAVPCTSPSANEIRCDEVR